MAYAPPHLIRKHEGNKMSELSWTIGDAASAVEEYQEELMKIVNEQAEDYGLWFQATTASEAYLQAALRRLHAVIENKTPEQCVNELIDR